MCFTQNRINCALHHPIKEILAKIKHTCLSIKIVVWCFLDSLCTYFKINTLPFVSIQQPMQANRGRGARGRGARGGTRGRGRGGSPQGGGNPQQYGGQMRHPGPQQQQHHRGRGNQPPHPRFANPNQPRPQRPMQPNMQQPNVSDNHTIVLPFLFMNCYMCIELEDGISSYDPIKIG